jgi:RsiW-degrading membrane proteinase PrsW (M82 family)
MTVCTILQFAISPVLFLILYIFLRFKYPKGDFSLFFKVFVIGLISILIIMLADWIIHKAGLDSLHSFHRTMFYAFILTAGLFELVKFLIVRFFAYKDKRFVNISDGIVYTLVAALGFYTSYSVYAYFFPPEFVKQCTYAWSIGPAVVSMAVVMGFFFGIAQKRRNSFIDLLSGLFAAIILHGVYRFCLLYNDKTLLLMALIAMAIIAVILIVRAVRTSEPLA